MKKKAKAKSGEHFTFVESVHPHCTDEHIPIRLFHHDQPVDDVLRVTDKVDAVFDTYEDAVWSAIFLVDFPVKTYFKNPKKILFFAWTRKNDDGVDDLLPTLFVIKPVWNKEGFMVELYIEEYTTNPVIDPKEVKDRETVFAMYKKYIGRVCQPFWLKNNIPGTLIFLNRQELSPNGDTYMKESIEKALKTKQHVFYKTYNAYLEGMRLLYIIVRHSQNPDNLKDSYVITDLGHDMYMLTVVSFNRALGIHKGPTCMALTPFVFQKAKWNEKLLKHFMGR